MNNPTLTIDEILKLDDKEFFQWLRGYYETKPTDEWCAYIRNDWNGRHCALGFLDKDFPGKVSLDQEFLVVQRVLDLTKVGMEYDLVRANNGYTYVDKPTPKARVLAYLDDKLKNF